MISNSIRVPNGVIFLFSRGGGQEVNLCHSQLQDEHHISAVLIDVMQRDDVGMLNLLQDVHLPLYFLPAHPS